MPSNFKFTDNEIFLEKKIKTARVDLNKKIVCVMQGQ